MGVVTVNSLMFVQQTVGQRIVTVGACYKLVSLYVRQAPSSLVFATGGPEAQRERAGDISEVPP